MSPQQIPPRKIFALEKYFKKQPDIVGAWLYGSRVTGGVHKESDWDFAVLFTFASREIFSYYGILEDLKRGVADVLHVPIQKIQMVDIGSAPIPLAFEIIQANTVLKGEDSLEIPRFENKIYSMYELDYLHHYQKFG